MAALLPATLERRLAAFAVDRLLVWSVLAVVGLLAWRLGEGSVLVVAGAVALTAVLVTAAYAVLLGRSGVTPGKGLTGLRVVGAGGEPLGVGPAALRLGLVGLLTLPTLGVGAAVLAVSAALDPERRRRGVHDRVGGATVVDARPRRVPAPAPVPAPPPELVNLTALRLAPSPPVGTTTPTPAAPAAVSTVAAPGSGPRPAWRVSFDSGESFLVGGLVLVGREPAARPGEQVQRMVELSSSDMSLSKTHAQFQVVPDGSLVVMDRGSTNGSTLVRGGVGRDLVAGRPTTLVDQDTVRFGDRTMRVARARETDPA